MITVITKTAVDLQPGDQFLWHDVRDDEVDLVTVERTETSWMSPTIIAVYFLTSDGFERSHGYNHLYELRVLKEG